MFDAAPFVLEQPMTPEVEAPVAPHSAAEDALVWEDHHHAEAEPMQVSQDHGQAPEDTAQTAGPAVYLEDEDFVFASSREASPREDEVFDAAPKVAAAAPVPDADDLSDRDILLREDEAILDEETLRELVAEIVRQELQGALGERITRNVRKLVRREIHRALTSQELE
jgi:hypothetical protein